ncbi:hypothetical protein [Streptomyces clavuligerus]|uniref:Uncharacterized protein n=1 Tax=Streptomyces clavuligerus TaxID=1901 RepID=B5GN90_STRCL|nr:hypothetical protein [Streptomyces clavuligerus]EDY47786.1 hypothetical protein SSCG_00814 [Streptomyces clavuligerus]EFG04225.1 Hypothetical protein SCLAV_p0738 [Streptomyces clavuligerus]
MRNAESALRAARAALSGDGVESPLTLPEGPVTGLKPTHQC